MWKNCYITRRNVFFYLSIMVLITASCTKDKYYTEGGKSDPVFKGTILQYLESKPVPFDSVVAVIKLAKLETQFSGENITFFAPTDYSIKKAILNTNAFLYRYGKDTINTLNDIDPAIWKKYLQMYMFHGSNKLKDYYQIDFSLKSVYPGQNYYSYNNTIFNIGVEYNDVVYTDASNNSVKGIKYAGYRQLKLSYIYDLSDPQNSWYTSTVASSDIQPSNGVVHVLNNNHVFGFGWFYSDVYASK